MFFYKTMVTNSKTIMKKNSLVNPITQLWAKHSYVIFKHKLLEFIKLAKTTCIKFSSLWKMNIFF
jgi:hypothetical protein